MISPIIQSWSLIPGELSNAILNNLCVELYTVKTSSFDTLIGRNTTKLSF